MQIARKLIIIFVLILTSSCAYIEKYRVEPESPQGLKGGVKADVKEFFNGDVNAFSIKFDANDKIVASRIIKINGSWEDDKGIIRQQFINHKGEKDSRTWLVTIEGENGDFTAIGHDILAPAQGIQTGNIVQMTYTLSKNESGVKTNIDYKDQMYLVDENSMIMISKLSKKGKYIGKEVISMSKDASSSNKTSSIKDKKIFAPSIKTVSSQEKKEILE